MLILIYDVFKQKSYFVPTFCMKQHEMLHSLPTIVRLLVLAEGVLMLDTLNTYSPSNLPVTVSVWV